jgi:hypothetical protein
VKVRADEHVSPKIVRALKEVSLSPGWELTCVREFHAPRTADETWIPKFAAEGGQAIITADAGMLKRPHQIVAIQQSGIIGVLLSSAWAEGRRHFQAASLIYHWPKIEAQLLASQPGDFWRVPSTIDDRDLEKIVVNYTKAAQAADKKKP